MPVYYHRRKNPNRVRFLVGLLLFCCFGQGTAQQFSDRTYGVYDGLSYVYVSGLYQDRVGRIWIGTYFGLNFFDGVAPIVNQRQIPALPDGGDNLTDSPDGTVWACAGNRLFRMNDITSTSLAIQEFSVHYGRKEPQQQVIFMTADHENQLWFSAQTGQHNVGKRLYCWVNDHMEDMTRRYFTDPEQRFRGILTDWPNRRILLLTDDGRLWELKKNRLTLLVDQQPLDRLLSDPAGRFYALAGTTVYRIEDQTISTLYEVPVPVSELRVCAMGLNGELAFQKTKGNRDVCWYDGKTVTNSNISSSPANRLLFDRRGDLWVGTSHHGLINIKMSGWQYFDKSEGWTEETNNVAEDKNGVVWFGSWGNGLSRLANNVIVPDQRYRKVMPANHFHPSSRTDADGNILMAGDPQGGILRYDGQQYQVLPHSDTLTFPLGFYDDVKRNRYLVTSNYNLLVYNRQTLALTEALPVPPDQYENIETDQFGRFWICGLERSLVWDGKSRIFRQLTVKNKGLPTRTVADIKRDKRGNLWLATGEGLWFYDYKTFRPIAASFIQRTITYCRPLGRYLMVGTLEGLFVLDMERFYETGEEWIAYFDQENGFRGSQCIFNGILLDSRGRLWVATRDRMMMISEKRLFQLLKPVPAGIQAFRDMRSGRLIKSPSGKLSFKSSENDLEVQLQASNEKNLLANTTHQYRLERLDGDPTTPEWSEPFRNNFFTLQNLSDGSYRLTIQAVRAEGLWCTQPIVQEFQIAPPWYATWWFRTMLIIQVVGTLFYGRLRQSRAIAKRRLKQLQIQRRMAQLELEASNREKKELEIRRELAEASRKRALLEVKAITNQIDPHFVANFLTAIQSITYEADPDTVVSYLAKFGSIFRNQLMSRSRVFWMLREELEFVANYLDLERLRFGDRITFTVTVAPGVPMDTTVPKMLIQGYVSNAIKHGLEHKAEGGIVMVSVSESVGCLRIKVDDNGVGLEKAKQYRRRSTGRGLKINQAVLDQLNQYNALKSSQHITDLTDSETGVSGVRQEAVLPIHPVLPPEESTVEP
ncbi:two-component regulator propeller domain-containing protein [Larkinella bovis]|uniref:Two-component regulator propeller domain-containing protein n=1 Tax=Larkinella bovis TaxID=683041 RepID=A0ABW0IB98_9BACT